MKTFNINIGGADQGDVETALEEVLRLVRQGYLSGANENDTGSFNFSSEGEYETDSERLVRLGEENDLTAIVLARKFDIPADRLNNGGVKEIIDLLIANGDDAGWIEDHMNQIAEDARRIARH